MSDLKLNFQNIAVNPVESFYQEISNNLDKIVDDFFEDKKISNQYDQNKVNEIENAIYEKRSEIESEYNRLKIGKIKIINFTIVFSCFLLVGLFFLSFYFKNKTIINEFEKFNKNKLLEIEELKISKNYEIYKCFSTLMLKDICCYVFNKLGISTIDYLNHDLLKNNFIQSDSLIDIYSGIYGIFKNTPFYDVCYRELKYYDIKTSNTVSFPYLTTISVFEDGKYVTKTVTEYETLTAIHVEPTPFIEKKNILVCETNFLKELTIVNNFSGYNKNIMLENKEFINTVRVGYNIEEEQKLLEFFTIKSQEDFVKWYNLQNGLVFNFQKDKNVFRVFNNDYKIDVFDKLNQTFDNFITQLHENEIEFNVILEKLKQLVVTYFIRWSKMMQLPLLVPGIAREWYRKNGNYLIANSSDLEVERIDNIDEIEPIEICNKFLDSKFITFNSDVTLARPIWFENAKTVKDKNNCYITKVIANSYYCQKLIDNVVVFGLHVGSKIIPVAYEKFFDIQQEKLLMFFKNFKKSDNQFIINKNMNHLIDVYQYQNKDLGNEILKSNIWTNNPKWLESSTSKDNILEIANSFNLFNKRYNLNGTLRIDEYGIYLFIDNVSEINETIIQQLSNKIKNFSKICNL